MTFPVRTAARRVYSDFLMPSRLPAYRQLLEAMTGAGYTVMSIDSLQKAGPDFPRPVVVLRHDVDTDPATARRMWEIDQDLGVSSSYFFRLSTLDIRLMTDISRMAGHASYHFEELATVAKRHRLQSRAALERHWPEALDDFARNVEAIRRRTGLPLDILASHGDFVNRRLGVPNWELIRDPAVRTELGITLEAYDEAAMGMVTSRHSDTGYPRFWIPDSPAGAIARREEVVYLLVHPRHWKTAPVVNARDDLGRIWQGLISLVPGSRRKP